MRIIITCHRGLAGQGGGTIGLVRIADGLCELGADVTVVPVDRDRGPEIARPRLARVVPVRPHALHPALDGRPVARAVAALAAAEPADAIIGWDAEAAFLEPVARASGAALGMIAAKPSYAAWIARGRGAHRRLADERLRARTFRRADVVFALSEFTRGELTEIFGVERERIVVAHWGVDPEFLSIPRPGPRPVRRLLFFGTFEPHKGLPDAVKALGSLIRAGRTDLVLRAGGWGPPEAVRGLARRFGAEGFVEVAGPLGRAELRAELEAADLAVLPSRVESFGLAVAEAQAAGVPVVAYRAGSVPEVVEHGVGGWLAQLGHTDALAAAIAAAARDPQEAFRRGLAGRARVASRFAWERTCETMLGALERDRGLVRGR